jgi:hypothetical protein
MRYIDYDKTIGHQVLLSNQDDLYVPKYSAKNSFVFGGAGDDEIRTPVDTVRQIGYGGISLRDANGGYFGHPMPSNMNNYANLWHDDGDDWMDMGNDDWWVGGGGADTAALHPNPGGYTAPALLRGFNPDEGDTFIFAQDEGFHVGKILSHRIGNGRVDVSMVDVIGHSSDFIQNGEWATMDMRTDGRGVGVDADGSNDYHMIIPLHGQSVRAAVTDYLHDHSAHYDLLDLAHDNFIL